MLWISLCVERACCSRSLTERNNYIEKVQTKANSRSVQQAAKAHKDWQQNFSTEDAPHSKPLLKWLLELGMTGSELPATCSNLDATVHSVTKFG